MESVKNISLYTIRTLVRVSINLENIKAKVTDEFKVEVEKLTARLN